MRQGPVGDQRVQTALAALSKRSRLGQQPPLRFQVPAAHICGKRRDGLSVAGPNAAQFQAPRNTILWRCRSRVTGTARIREFKAGKQRFQVRRGRARRPKGSLRRSEGQPRARSPGRADNNVSLSAWSFLRTKPRGPRGETLRSFASKVDPLASRGGRFRAAMYQRATPSQPLLISMRIAKADVPDLAALGAMAPCKIAFMSPTCRKVQSLMDRAQPRQGLSPEILAV